ncbi:DUF4167 domain-containing protein [Azospirillum argentinense]|uniref:DUF4167 domain-containing protein n=1 Tax=Azospirillum brasilense TaxID=192 RepID=A0A4D8Q0S0_AZOBR|nr:DUF4167 domain-containing protein [Azospirillum argentinense]QCO03398.1 DUF4167 domain-containing protein [Azospirillum argentinense]
MSRPGQPAGFKPPRPQFSKPRQNAGQPHGTARQPPRVNGSAQQKNAQWLARADEAERSGDSVQAELCRQYAEHWFRVSRGQE